MKILSTEEKNAHTKEVLIEGLKGLVVGLALSWGLVRWTKTKRPASWSQMNTSVRAAMWAVPTIGVAAYFADQGSYEFDIQTYQLDSLKQKEKEELDKWDKLSTADKVFTKVNENKYKIIVGAWAATLYGSWKIVDRDPIMTTAQKAVQARVYAQAFTVILLLGTILMSMHEAELKKKEPAPVPEWKRYLEEQEAKKKELDAATHKGENKASN